MGKAYVGKIWQESCSLHPSIIAAPQRMDTAVICGPSEFVEGQQNIRYNSSQPTKRVSLVISPSTVAVIHDAEAARPLSSVLRCLCISLVNTQREDRQTPFKWAHFCTHPGQSFFVLSDVN